jgi:hypothetical protein
LRWFFLVALAALVPVLSGCGKSSRIPVYPVKGVVYVDDKPAKEAMVSLHPREAGSHENYVPSGKTDENGQFSLSTFVADDGAPAGEFDVIITWPVRYNPISTLWEGDRLKGRYGDRKKPAFQVTIEPKPQELPPFQLKGPPAK